MPRVIDPGILAAMTQKFVRPVFMVDISQGPITTHACSIVGQIVWNGNTYFGVGDLGDLQLPTESSDVQANGAGISLAGVSQEDVMDALNTLQIGGPATIYMGFLDDNNQLAGNPIVVFKGIIDPPTIGTAAVVDFDGNTTAKVSIPIESRLAVLGSGQQRKYTRTDQSLTHPDDSGLNWVEEQNDLALLWGAS